MTNVVVGRWLMLCSVGKSYPTVLISSQFSSPPAFLPAISTMVADADAVPSTSSSPCQPPPAKQPRPAPTRLRFTSLDHDFETTPTTIPFLAVSGVPNSAIATLLKAPSSLGEAYPHLKRVNGDKHVLIGPADDPVIEAEAAKVAANYDNATVYTVQVPATASTLRCHYEKTIPFWPVKFKVNKSMEAMFKGEMPGVSGTQLESIYFDFLERLQNRRGCIVYDPKRRKVLAEGYADAGIPLKHAVFATTATVASHANDDTYYANGCDVLLSQEPCMMCAFALNHMRVSNVLYLESNPKRGAFEGRKLHKLWTKCHRYGVFRVSLE
uniref:CMP/dCMP-type deaminase domain-containing protein n=1 Tax=Panagrellus redivivus TaxID=6233 RepID=A0A7E4V6G4_PANRE